MAGGNVKSGEGKAADFIGLKPYRKFIEHKSGISPYPGTLNLDVEPEKLKELKERAGSKEMESTEFRGRELGGIEIFYIEIEGMPALIVEAEKSRHGDNTAEVAAAKKLRSEMDLKDGDKVEIKPVENEEMFQRRMQ